MSLLFVIIKAAIVVQLSANRLQTHFGEPKKPAIARSNTDDIRRVIDDLDSTAFGRVTNRRFRYDFRRRWGGLSFEEKWKMFREEVPVENLQGFYDPVVDQGPVCWPTLVGPEDSDKLAILTHGFLSCPGMWYRVVPQLVAKGFRVMLPTLPGHGRNYMWASDGEVVDYSDLMKNSTTTRKDKVKDDLSELPVYAQAYTVFADALQHLAIQFKKEHPNGIVVAAGHSLGGAITAKYAFEIPNVVDRVLLLNPMLGLEFTQIETVARLSPSISISKGASCEKKRGTGSGGTCQFRLRHVLTMADFAFSTLCCHWGLQSVCGTRTRLPISFFWGSMRTIASIFFRPAIGRPDFSGAKMAMRFHEEMQRSTCGRLSQSSEAERKRSGFGQIRNFQVVTSKGEFLVDNSVIMNIVHEVQWRRALEPHGYSSKFGLDFCLWPSDLGHAYMSNRPSHGKAEKWWHPYVEHAVAEFLQHGKSIDVVDNDGTSKNAACLQSSSDVAGSVLTKLPARQWELEYWIGKKGVPWATPIEIIFQGSAIKESEWWGKPHERSMEILRYLETFLLVTRLLPHNNVRDIFALRNDPIHVHLNAFALEESSLRDKEIATSKCCVKPNADSVSTDKPLAEAVEAALENNSKPYVLSYCGKGFIHKLCERFTCFMGSEATPVSLSWLKQECEEDVAIDFEEAPWQCHNYAAGQNNDWCRSAGTKYGYEYQFNGGENSPCGGCGCCKREAPMYKVVPGTVVPPEYERVGTWQEGIQAAKQLGYTGDAVAHGSYGADDCNLWSGKRPKGMFRDSKNGRFHFNCGKGGNTVEGDAILVKQKATTLFTPWL